MEAVEQSCPTAYNLRSAGFPRHTAIMRTAMAMLHSVELNEWCSKSIESCWYQMDVFTSPTSVHRNRGLLCTSK